MARDYRTWIPSRMPTWGKANWFAKYIHAYAVHLDALLQGVVEGIKARALHIAPDDALPKAGSDSNLPQYPKETLQSYRARLRRRFDDWPAAGTEGGMLGQYLNLQTLAEIKENADWNWDGSTANWSRFWVTIPPPSLWHSDGTWDSDSAVWDDGGVWDSSDMTLEDVAALRGIPLRFEPAHVKGELVIVIFDLTAWNAALPNGTWGDPANWNPNAMYISIWDGG